MKRASDVRAKTADKHRTVECPECGSRMKSNKLSRHLKVHNPERECRFCGEMVRGDMLFRHMVLCRDNVDESLCNRKDCSLLDDSLECSSVSGCFKKFKLEVRDSTDYDRIIINAASAAGQFVKDLVSNHPIKAQIVLDLEFFHDSYEGREFYSKIFRSILEPLLVGDDIKKYLKRAAIYLKSQIEIYQRNGSGWQFNKLNGVYLEVSRYHPLAGSGKVVIPKKVKDMKSVLNINAPGNKCFLYCILAKLFPVNKNPKRHTKYLPHIDAVNLDGVDFPIKIADIKKIESLNDLSISVFQWCDEDDSVIPLHHGCGVGRQIDLLHISKGLTGHYLLIKNFNAFMRHRTKHKDSMFYCRRCLHGFTTADLLDAHADLCQHGVNQIEIMPKPGTVIEFKAHHKQDKKLFAVYFDFECLTVPITEDSSAKKTVKYQKHVPNAFCIVTESVFGDYKKKVVNYSSSDPSDLIETFLKELEDIHKEMMHCYENNQYPLDWTEEVTNAFENAKDCHICGKEFEENSKNYRVADHDHTLKENNFRGIAHNICNLNYFNRTKKVPAFCHNLKSYDMNLFLLELIKSKGDIDIIPENLEKFKAVFTEQYTFMDSFAFLSSSLDKLAEDLKKSDQSAFKRLRSEYPERYKDLMNKGVYFYDHASSSKVLEEEKLPPREAFFNKLKDEHISEAEYKRAQEIFEKFDCKTLKDYMDLYVKCDALLLCDIFEHFRELCLNYYGLDPCHYLSLPGFTWDAMLKKTGVKIELISDKDQYKFVEKGLKGGLSTINHREFTANNPYLSNFNPEKPRAYIHYVDANNLYGASMMKPLQTGNYRWLTAEEIEKLDVLKIDPNGDTSFILEVDLDYPDELHDDHTDYPLAVEKKGVKKDQLSDYNKDFLEKTGDKHVTTLKLCPDLNPKRNYVISLQNLQLCLNQGLLLVKIHRVLAADQSCYLKPYIEFNSKRRLEAKSKFSSDFFKLCNNAIYGKFIEDVRKRINVTAVKERKRALKIIAKPQYKGFRALDESVTLVQTLKKKIELNKPIACGFTVLENAKTIMGDFWYNVLKPKYGDRIKLILSDTDSFIYAVYTEDGYADLLSLKDYMDLSGYASDGPLAKFKDDSNKKVPGKFSDERPTEVIKEVVALKPKMYSLLTESLESHTENHSVTAKGVSRAAQKKITHEDYKNVLRTSGVTTCVNRAIRSVNRELFTVAVTKRALSAFDDKKYILEDGVSTLSYGHYKLRDE